MTESDGASTVVGTPQNEREQGLESTTSRPSSKRSGNSPLSNNTDVEKGTATHTDSTPAAEPRKAVPEGYREYDDPNIVNWDGPDDPDNPYNWKLSKKIIVAGSIAAITFITPLGSSMFSPGVGEVMKEFESTSAELSSFVVSVYLLGFSFGPLLIAPISEMYGRAPCYHVCNVVFIVFNVACALSKNLDSLIVFRFLAGSFGSAPLTIGAGSIADMICRESRGGAMAAWALGPLLGPVIGPIAGAYLTEAVGWRWTFWVLAMASGVVTLNSFIFLTESYHPVLLERKTKRLIKETGNHDLRSALDLGKNPKELFTHSIVRPLKMLFMSPIVFMLSLYVAVVYGYMYLLFTTMSMVFMGTYGFSQGNVGLSFLGLGVGCLLGLAVVSVLSDYTLKRLSAKAGGEMKPEFRIPPLIPAVFFLPIGLFWYGWSADQKLHWIMPIIGTGWIGVGMIISFMAVSTYLVDAYTIYSASVMAANTLFRSVVGAVLPLCGQRMYDTLGLGWGNSLLGFIALAMAPLPFVFYKYGERIRTSKRFSVTF